MLTQNEKKLFAVIGVVVVVIGGLMVYKQIEESSAVKIKKANSAPQSSSPEEAKESQSQEEKLLVHIGGAVNNPGVYECKSGTRLYKVIEKAEGPTDQANLNAVNLAKPVRDGEKFIIPAASKKNAPAAQSQVSTSSAAGKININTANQKKLEQLSGIGPALAGRIIKYRQQNSSFQSKKELTKVSGIGEKTLAKLKDQITY